MGSRLRSEAEGFALIEVMVSAVILIVFALALFPVIELSQARSGTQRSRGVASTIASSEQNRLRSLDVATRLANLRETTTRTVDNVTYQIINRADPVQDGSGTVSCQSPDDGVDYVKLRTEVTWPKMNGVPAVVSESLVAPPVNSAPGTGTLSVRVSRADASPATGVGATVGGYSDVTNELGCAVFGNLTAGTLTLGVSMGGYVTPDGIPTISTPVQVNAGKTARYATLYDAAGTVPARFDTVTKRPPTWTATPSAPPTPKAYGYSLNQQGLATPRVFRTSVTTVPQNQVTATGVFPFTSSYTSYAGVCQGNNPTKVTGGDPNYFTTTPGTNAVAALAPGETEPERVGRMPDLFVTVSQFNVGASGATSPISGAAVKVTPDTSVSTGDPNMIGCSGEMYPVQGPLALTAPVDGTTTTGLDVPVPFGTYTVCTSAGGQKASVGGVRVTSPAGVALPELKIPRTGSPGSC